MGQPRQTPHLVPSGDIEGIIEMGVALQVQATAHNIHNVFDDGGYKELLILTLFGLRKLDREGDDAEDAQGRRYEIKTVARVSSRGARKRSLSITTEHTLTIPNIQRYRRSGLWVIAVFDQAKPEAIYQIAPDKLEPYFAAWEQQLTRQEQLRAAGSAPPHLNNPKIPLWFVEQHGLRVWPLQDVALPESVERALSRAENLNLAFDVDELPS